MADMGWRWVGTGMMGWDQVCLKGFQRMAENRNQMTRLTQGSNVLLQGPAPKCEVSVRQS